MGGSQELIRRRNLPGFKPAKALSDPLLQYRRERSFDSMDFEDVPKPHQPKACTHYIIKITLLFNVTNISLSFLPFLTMVSGFIIQWKCRGLAVNPQELKLLAGKYNAPVICLQEKNLKDDQMTLKGYIAFHKIGTIYEMDRAHGGVSTFLKTIYHRVL